MLFKGAVSIGKLKKPVSQLQIMVKNAKEFIIPDKNMEKR